jgi:hypothetical protein
MRSENIFWGVALVLLGVLLLADNMGWMPAGVSIWSLFWPFVLIVLGIRGIMRAFGRGAMRAEILRLPLENARALSVRMRHGAGELRIDDRAAPDELVNGSFGGGVDHQLTQTGDNGVRLDLRSRVSGSTFIFPFDMPNGLNWQVGFNPDVPLNLDLGLGASRNLIDLRNLKVRDLHLETGASSTEIDLPAHAGLTRAKIQSGAASVVVRIPSGVAANIRAHGGLSSVNIDTTRFQAMGGYYRSADYETAENRIDLDIETGVGSVNIR